jgi:hypothetical protein
MSIYDTIIISSLKTGNQFVDSILIILLTSLLGYLVNNAGGTGWQKWSSLLYSRGNESVVNIEKFIVHDKNRTFQNLTFNSMEWFLSLQKSSENGIFDAQKIVFTDNVLISIGRNASKTLVWKDEKVNVLYRFQKDKGEKEMIVVDQGLTLTYNGKKKNLLHDLIIEVEKQYMDHEEMKEWKQLIHNIYRSSGDYTQWIPYSTENYKMFDNIIMDKERKGKLVSDVRTFLSSEKLYKKRGVSWTRGYIFHGEPGCGKTSLVKAIANEAKMHIYSLDLSCIKNDQELRTLFRSIPVKSLILMEDVDALSNIVQKRDEKDLLSPTKQTGKAFTDKGEGHTGPTLSALLNELDGIITQKGRITVMTTNHIKNLDPALIRPGRFDFIYELKKASVEEIAQCMQLFTSTEISRDEILPELEGKHTLAEVFNMINGGLVRDSLREPSMLGKAELPRKPPFGSTVVEQSSALRAQELKRT